MNKLTRLDHLRSLGDRARSLISQVATAASEAVEELDGSKLDKPAYTTVSLTAAGWADNTDSDTKAAYPKRYALTVSGATASDSASCVLTPASIAAAVACGMSPTVTVAAGYLYFYAEEAPSDAISIQYHLIRA